MKAKEKAKELYCKYADALNIRDLQITANPFAKACALIAVDEILDVITSIYDYDFEKLNPFWQQVKQEINNL